MISAQSLQRSGRAHSARRRSATPRRRRASATRSARNAAPSPGNAADRSASSTRLGQRTRPKIRGAEKPSVLSTPISRCARGSTMHHRIADDDQNGRRRRRPRRNHDKRDVADLCRRRPCRTPARSSVEVSAVSSRTSCRCLRHGSVVLRRGASYRIIQPMVSLAEAARLVEVGVVERHERRRRHADLARFTMPATVRSQVCRPVLLAEDVALIGIRSPTFQSHFLRQRFADQRLPRSRDESRGWSGGKSNSLR